MQTLNRLFRLLATLSLLLLPVQPPVHATGLLTLGVSQEISVGGGGSPSVTFIGCTYDSSDQAVSYTFNSVNTGTASADRVTIITPMGEDSASAWSFNSVTIDGDSATEAGEYINNTLTTHVALYVLANPSGTSETVVVTPSEGITAAGICVWQANNISTSPWRETTDGVPTGANIALPLATGSGGIAIGACAGDGAGATTTWAAGLTERFDTSIAGNEFSMSAADATPSSGGIISGCDSTSTGSVSALTAFFNATAPASPVATLLQCTTNGSSGATVHTFTSEPVGTANDFRTTVVGVIIEDGASLFSISSMTIGGDSATETTDQGGSLVISSGFYFMHNYAATAENIVVTTSEAITSPMVICTWEVTNLILTYLALATQSTSGFDTASASFALNTIQLTNGPIMAVCANNGVADTVTWGVISELNDTQSASFDYSAASMIAPGIGTALITCDWTGGNDAVGSTLSLR